MRDWGLGIGDWGLGIGAQSPIPNPQSPIPNPQSPFPNFNSNICIIALKLYLHIFFFKFNFFTIIYYINKYFTNNYWL